ncbi:FecCD family ABC transporter permease [Luteimonas huabeiensis]|uniref:FecCD family ABC transporter permease n=1 Tax=Luteimonas huabeiensis TaxID=1244513 RepID=UPI000467A43D|nr:iron ABC transporter permease [Luteimonas huabeiensis]
MNPAQRERGGAAPPRSPEARRRRLRIAGVFVCLGLLLALAAISICAGVRPIAPAQALAALQAFDPADSEHLLVRHLRLPRTALAVLVGAALGVAGAIMQALTRNPLADPGLLGVNAGAAVAIVAAIAFLGVHQIAAYLGFGLAGAALAGAAVYLLGGLRQGYDPVRLVLAGAAMTVLLLALTQLITLNSDEAVFDQFRHWSVGSLQGRGLGVLPPVALLVAAGLALAALLAGALDAIALGEDVGRALGVRPGVVWGLSALAIVLLAGAATAAAGPIAFIGLTAPHVARAFAGVNHRWTMLYSALIGALVILAADVLGRVLLPPDEIAVGIMVALLGGGFFVALARRRRIVRL